MTSIRYNDHHYDCRADETVLDALLRQGANVTFSCRSGVCQVCLHRSVDGAPPVPAQRGLKPELIEQNYFLPCLCQPQHDMAIAPPNRSDLFFTSVIAQKTLLAPSILQLKLEPPNGFTWQAGQFINLRRADGVTRSYSIASQVDDYFLELHIQRKDNGVLSNWLFDQAEVGCSIDVHGPLGDCVYRADDRQQALILIGTGTGIAPLLGVLRNALAHAHRGPIYIYHGACYRADLYLDETFRQLETQHNKVNYFPVLSRETQNGDWLSGRINGAMIAQHGCFDGAKFFISGRDEIVSALRDQLFEQGIDHEQMILEPFVFRDLRGKSADHKPRRTIRDSLLWQALNEGELLHTLLVDFYQRVYADPLLSPFFANVTQQRLVEKQYSFLREQITGDKVYFGDRPRNAHHWMVISDELFNHRERLMETVLREHGIAEHYIQRLQQFENQFRDDIVKTQPLPRQVAGVDLAVDGFDQCQLDVGSMCDSCAQAIDAGTSVRYHLRTGKIYCPQCMNTLVQEPHNR